MLVNYNLHRCNIKSCNRKQDKKLLCAEHYRDYISDSNIADQISRLNRIVFKKKSKKDAYKYYKNFILHHVTGIHVPYIEHFPLETIFLYHEKTFLQGKESDLSVSREQFISNFDWEWNVYMDRLKVKSDSSQFFEPFKKFSKSKLGIKHILFPTICIVMLSVSFFLGKYFNLDIPFYRIWKIVVITSICAISVLISGAYYTNNVKSLINEAVKNKLLDTKPLNKKFLKKCHQWISSISTMEENLFYMYGFFFAFFCIGIWYGINQIDSSSFFSNAIFIGFTIFAFVFGISIFKITWNNRFLLKIIRRIPNENFLFNLYDKDKRAGVEPLMKYLRATLIYSLCVVITVNLSYVNLNNAGFEVSPSIILILSFFFSWNFASPFIVFYKFQKLKSQFKKSKKSELNRLNDINTSASFVKFEFLKKMDLKFLPIGNYMSSIGRVLLYMIPIVASYLITKYIDEINNLFDYIFK